MSALNPEAFLTAVEAHLPSDFGGRFCIAFSGGLDSTALLHLFADLRSSRPAWRIRAMHIDHQLQPASAEWAVRCATIAESLGVAFESLCVDVDRHDAQGLEAAARRSRYAGFALRLEPGEALVTAHHADDQAETVLLALMRGSGVHGLAAMPACKRWVVGWHLRPLLRFTRRDIAVWARERGIQAIEDPANALLRHDRNFLRHEVLPRLASRWPSVAASIGRSAEHLGESLEILNSAAEADLNVCSLGSSLRVEALLAMPAVRRRNLLRYWLRRHGVPAPSTRKLAGLEKDLESAGADRAPRVEWPGAEVCWSRGLLYVRHVQPDLPADLNWERSRPLALPDGLGTLACVPTQGPGLSAARLPHELTVRFRRGGEKIRLPGRAHRHELKKLLQEQDVLPWWRDRLPLIYVDRSLVAVGDMFHADEFSARPGETAVKIEWHGAPPWRAQRSSE